MRLRRSVPRALLAVTAAVTSIALATPAWASTTVSINGAHKGAKADTFGSQDCKDERFASLPDGYDGWHFILPGGKDSGSFETLTLTFNDGVKQVQVKVPDATDAYPDAFYAAGQDDSRLIHAYLFTPDGWTLVDGTATISGTASKFNLSHTCGGTDTPDNPGTPTPTPTPSTPGEDPSPTPGTPGETSPGTPGGTPTPGTGGGGGGEGGLPLTGAAATTIALLGVALIGGGATLLVLRRRRNITFVS